MDAASKLGHMDVAIIAICSTVRYALGSNKRTARLCTLMIVAAYLLTTMV